MRKTLLKFLLVYLMVLPSIITFGQELPPSINSEQNYQSMLPLNHQDFSNIALPNSYSEAIINENSNTGYLKTEFNNYAKSGFSQASATVLFSEDFYPAEYGVTPPGWYVAGDASENWRIFSNSVSEAGGTRPEMYFYHTPGFSGYTKLVCDSIFSTSGYSTLALGLKALMKYKNAGYTLRIETTSDFGTTWNIAWEKLVNSTFGPDSLIIIINTPDVGSDNFQFAISFEGSTTNLNRLVFDDLLLTEGPDKVFDITFNLTDIDSNVVNNALITLDGYGSLSADANGQAVYKNVIPDKYTYSIVAKNLEIIADTLILTDSNLTLDITMEEPVYLFYEDFTIEPNGWTKHYIPIDVITWYAEAMRFTSNGYGDILYVTPEIDLYKDSTIVIEVGNSTNGGVIGVGIVTDPNDTSTYTQIAQFDLESNYRYFKLLLPDTVIASKHIGFKHVGSTGNYFSLSTVYMEPKAEYISHKATFIVKDTDGNLIKNAEVSLDRNGTRTSDSLGQAIFSSVFSGTYDWSANVGLNYSRSAGTLNMGNNDTIIDVLMEAPDYYFYENFEASPINNWTYHTSGKDICQWNAGKIMYYNQDADITNAIMAVTPEIDLSNVESVTAYVGGNQNGIGTIIFGTLSDVNDTNTFTPLTSFTVGLGYQFFTANISEYNGSDKYFGFKGDGPFYNFFYMDLVYMEAKASVEKYPVTFIVKDENGNLYEGAMISIPGFGSVFTDNTGQALIDLYPQKEYTWTISADDLFARERVLSLADASKTVSVTMKNKHEYYMLEEFETGIPFNWSKIVSSGDGLEYWGGEITYYNYLDSEDPIILVSPEIDLSKVDAITVEIGKELISQGGIIIGAMSDPTDTASFQALGTVEAVDDFEFYSIDVSDIDITGSYLGFKNAGSYPSYLVLRTIYVEGRGVTEYCMDSAANKDGWIANVEFDDINNDSDWQPEVADYTHLSTRIEPGNSDFITVTNGNPKASDAVTVWVDWNQNFEFEPGTDEEFILDNDGTGTTFTSEIVIPEGIKYGRFPMRIRMINDGTPAPCGEINNGETEDYVLKVTDERDPAAGIVFEDNFDTYLVDDYVACQNPDVWNTSNNNPCGGKDVLVSASQAYSGTNSANVIKGDDIIMDLNKYFTLGKHAVNVMIYVPTGGDAYYALLSAYKPDVELAFEAYFSADGTGSINAGGTATATFSFAFDTWIESKLIIDLANDSAELFIDSVSVHKWQYTAGATGTGCAPQFGALRLSAATDATNYFIDDVVIETLAVHSPLAFSAEVVTSDDVEMKWHAPLGEEYMHWDNGTKSGALGLWGTTFYAASRWTKDDLKPYDDNYITSITFVPKEGATFTLKAWVGEAAEKLILSQEVTSLDINEFNKIELDHPILINSYEDLWFGYEISNYSGYPAGLDNGPAVSNKGDLYSTDGVNWISLTSIRWDKNWCLQAYVSTTANGKELAKPMVKESVTPSADFNYKSSLLPEVIESNELGAKNSGSNTKALGGFVGYNIYRDGEIIIDSLKATYFVDYNLEQGSYAYEVKAVFDEGISASAMPGAIDIVVGKVVPRELVLIEIATGTWCVNCPGAAMAAEEMHAAGHKVGIVEYHQGDDYQTRESVARIDYYNPSGYPSTWFDGGNTIPGGSPSTSLYPNFLAIYNDIVDIPTPFGMESFYYNTDEDNYTLDVDVEMIGVYSDLSNLKVFASLTESHIEETWFIMDVLDFVCRDMLPDQNGTSVDFTNDTLVSFDIDFDIPEAYVKENLELVVYLQDITTMEILQTVIAPLGTKPPIDPDALAEPKNLTGPEEVVINTDYVLTWETPDSTNNALKEYKIYRQIGDADFALVGSTSAKTFTDNVSESVTANYYVTADYAQGESKASNTWTVNVITNIEESIFNNTVLYPNPASKAVNITSIYTMESITVYNYTGQVVLTESVNNTNYQINSSGFESGVYLFQIETKMGRIAKQIVIE